MDTNTRTDAGLAAAATLGDHRYTRLDAAMAPYRETLGRMWGLEFPALRDYLAIATTPWRVHAATLHADLKRDPRSRTLILVGERATEPGVGMREEQFLAALQAVKLCEGSDTPYHILFTGGVYGLETAYGERPAFYLQRDFHARTYGAYAQRCSIEQLSQHTGHQARIIGQIVQSVGFRRIVVCIPIEHIARFSATLAYDLEQRTLAVQFVFFGDGNWEDEIPQRKMTRAREAFGPIQKVGDPYVRLATKLLGGEYEDRLATECDPEKSKGYACPALRPSRMLGCSVAAV